MNAHTLGIKVKRTITSILLLSFVLLASFSFQNCTDFNLAQLGRKVSSTGVSATAGSFAAVFNVQSSCSVSRDEAARFADVGDLTVGQSGFPSSATQGRGLFLFNSSGADLQINSLQAIPSSSAGSAWGQYGLNLVDVGVHPGLNDPDTRSPGQATMGLGEVGATFKLSTENSYPVLRWGTANRRNGLFVANKSCVFIGGGAQSNFVLDVSYATSAVVSVRQPAISTTFYCDGTVQQTPWKVFRNDTGAWLKFQSAQIYASTPEMSAAGGTRIDGACVYLLDSTQTIQKRYCSPLYPLNIRGEVDLPEDDIPAGWSVAAQGSYRCEVPSTAVWNWAAFIHVSAADTVKPSPTPAPTASPVPADSLAVPILAPSQTRAQFVSAGSAPDCFKLGRGPVQRLNLVYKEAYRRDLGMNAQLQAYVHYPPNFSRESGQRLPVVAMFHGGGWAAGEADFWLPAANYFASRGVIAISFEYRLINFTCYASIADFPADSVADARSAIRWIKANAKDLAFDSSRIAAIGDSAGGHLALSTYFNDQVSDDPAQLANYSSRPQLVMAAYPVIDAPPGINPIFSITEGFNRSGTAPPILIGHGTGEVNVPMGQTPIAGAHPWSPYVNSEKFCNRVNAAVGGCTLVPYQGEVHDFLSAGQDAAKSLQARMDRFLIDNGFLSGDVTQLDAWVRNSPAECQMHGTPTFYIAPACAVGH